MARKIKIEPAILRRRERQEERRKKDTRTIRKRYLIVCEGEKTEPNYFRSLKQSLAKGVLDVVDFQIIGEGFNTESLVERAIDLLRKWEQKIYPLKIDKLWIVFDKDSFSLNAFNSALQMCQNNPQAEAIWSNEAFELWYLLHFEYYDTGIPRDTYKSRIQSNFRNKGAAGFVYAKNRTDMLKLLAEFGNVNFAIKNAKRLHDSYVGNDFANHNPCTLVYKLVADLYNLEETINDNEAK